MGSPLGPTLANIFLSSGNYVAKKLSKIFQTSVL